MAVGSRAHLEKAALAKRTWLRNFLMHGFHALVTFVAGHDVNDTQCGFKVGSEATPARRGLWEEQYGTAYGLSCSGGLARDEVT